MPTSTNSTLTLRLFACVLLAAALSAAGCSSKKKPPVDAGPLCGNGVVDDGTNDTEDNGEECDDGNDVDDDECTNSCTEPVCGDGIAQESNAEACDDGNNDNTDGCNVKCATPGLNGIVDGDEECDDGNNDNTDDCLSAVGKPASCGDGFVHKGKEACDDGNDDNSDSCTNDCKLAECGDGYRQNSNGEACDDGNDVDDDDCTNDCATKECGDGIVQDPEECDDGNNDNNDGCLNSCLEAECGDGVRQSGEEQCDDGNTVNRDGCTNDCKNAVCGDGFTQPGEGCDDGNDTNDDGCSNDCVPASCGDGVVQGNEECDDGNTNPFDACLPNCVATYCGDGVVQASVVTETETRTEQCDDGNAVDTDNCTTDCQPPSCGDGHKQPGEGCDDGNNDDGDGCQGDCTLPNCGDGVEDVGEECDDGNSVNTDACTNACTDAACGDGFRQTSNGEACDDGNADNNDACLDTCERAACGDGVLHVNVEQCEPALLAECNADCTLPLCGNGDVDGIEQCDDGNLVNDDACTNNCTTPRCGDGVLNQASEQCDDGNNVNTDACTNTCKDAVCGDGYRQLSAGEQCDLGANNSDADGAMCSTTCKLPSCGDGTRQGLEECDDGNTVNTDDCSNSCTKPVCGDGIPQPATGEECDDGNDEDIDLCTTACLEAVCGDGFEQTAAGEECDDMNDVNTDFCNNACFLTTTFPCGDGVLQMGEECDDGTQGVQNGMSADPDNADSATGDFNFVGEAQGGRCSLNCEINTCGDGIRNCGGGGGFDPNVAFCNAPDVDGDTTESAGADYYNDLETCDDANQNENDYCRNDCTLNVCGDGFRDCGIDGICDNADDEEGCDEGALDADDNDGCRINCQVARCHDGVHCEPNSDPPCPVAEACDDGNSDNDDSCVDECVIATCGDGHVWSDGGVEQCDNGGANSNNSDCTIACNDWFCGDGFINFGPDGMSDFTFNNDHDGDDDRETCDSGGGADNNDNGIPDVETFPGSGVYVDCYPCDDADTDGECDNPRACAVETCGDGALNNKEECDDGNTDNNDECTNRCLFNKCGDGYVNEGADGIAGTHDDVEECDSTSWWCNLNGADGVFGTSDDCSVHECGDGRVDEQAGEVCDDGNDVNDDNCPNNCRPKCGDGVTQGPYEECDDGNRDDNDECTNECQIFDCDDGILYCGTDHDCDTLDADNSQEECEDEVYNGADDGSTDGCDAQCHVVVPDLCGDGPTGATNGGEDCDDANENDNDQCKNNCQENVCGDGVLDYGVDGQPDPPGDSTPDDEEECDDGNTDSQDNCTEDCKVNVCGDGEINYGNDRIPCDAAAVAAGLCPDDDVEECDDGNKMNGDGCNSNCQLEPGNAGLCGGSEGVYYDDGDTDFQDHSSNFESDWGADGFGTADGHVQVGEQCDDGDENGDPGDTDDYCSACQCNCPEIGVWKNWFGSEVQDAREIAGHCYTLWGRTVPVLDDSGDTDVPNPQTQVDCGPLWASTWESAELFCQSIGGHLASINSAQENQDVAEFVNQNLSTGPGGASDGLWDCDTTDQVTQAWIGLNDRAEEGTFRWTDMSALGMSFWDSDGADEQDALFGAGQSIWVDCVAIEGSQVPAQDYGTWADLFCPRGWRELDGERDDTPDPQRYLPFVCEVNPCQKDCDVAYGERPGDYPAGPTQDLFQNN